MSDVAARNSGSSFRIDQLWTDSRYRSTFFQIVALIAFVSFFFWLGSNAVRNLEILGKDFSFVFMTQPSSYDINQVLFLDYTSRSSHATASVVGMINTLLIAVLGCFAATLIGVLAGVARLSKNWIVARLMTIYIEGVRNIPVLLQIVLWYAIFIETLPAPNAFKGDDAAATMTLGGNLAATNRGFYLTGPVFAEGSFWVILAFLAGIVAIVMFSRYSRDLQQQTGDVVPPSLQGLPRWLAPASAAVIVLGLWTSHILRWDIVLIGGGEEGGFTLTLDLLWHLAIGLLLAWGLSRLGAPAAVRLALILLPVTAAFYLVGAVQGTPPITWDVPELKGFNFQGGIYARNSFVALWLALSVYTGAFIAENVRAGILSVSKGQTEAAFALGLRPNRTMSLIILPQALRVIIPPLISQYLNLTKNSSLAIAVGYMDVTGTLGGITLNQTGKEMQTILLLMAFYLSISLSISFVMNLYNENVKLVERTSATGFGLSFARLFGGRWQNMKKGDARMRPDYGIGGWLNAVVLFYALWFCCLVYFIFASEAEGRGSYYTWSTYSQATAILMLAMAAATLATALLKGSRFIDLAVIELTMFILAAISGPVQTVIGAVFPSAGSPEAGFDFGLVIPEIGFLQGISFIPELDAMMVIIGGVAIRIAIIGYAGLGRRPNITYLHRVREGGA